jgi:HEAT repeat protein
MIRIDAPRAVRAMLPMIIARRDWPLARLVAVLQRGRGEAIAGVLIEAIGQAPAAELPRLLTIARILPPQRLAPTLRRILREHRDAEILARTLKLLADPRDAPLLREFLKHAEWTVRLAAVRSLGRVAREEDLPLLVEALADPIWWVRQRAAEAIVRLPFFDDALRERLCAPAADRYARDAVQRALAERDRG